MTGDAFDAARPRLRGLAYRLLGTLADADDVLQETWLRWRTADDVERPEAWLVSVATRICIDRLRSAARRREAYPGPWLPEPIVDGAGPEEAAMLADSLTLAFLVLLDQLDPVERAVFVLADVFAVPFADIAPMVGRSPEACRQVASRARRRLRPGQTHRPVDAREREVLDGLLGAVAAGDVAGVVARLAPDVVCLSDGGPLRRAARRPVVGPERVSRLLVNLAARFAGRLDLRPALVGGATGAVIYLDGAVDMAMAVETVDGRVTSLRLQRNPDKLTSVGRRPAIE